MNIGNITNELRARQDSLKKRLQAINSDLGRGRDQDSQERAVEAENDEVLAGFEHEARAELGAISAALSRIEKGNFGTCVLCGAAIGEARLNALPFTPYCVECARDLSGK